MTVDVVIWHNPVDEPHTATEVKRISCTNERQAERVENGVNINLNHDQYYTTIEGGSDWQADHLERSGPYAEPHSD